MYLSFAVVSAAIAGVSAAISGIPAARNTNWLLQHVKTLATTANAPPTQYVDMPIDHFGSSEKGTFKNRYWYNDQYYQSGGPVVVMDVGESDAEDFVPFLEDGEGVTSAVMELAQKYKGIGVIWEHRYYGKSLPFDVTTVQRLTKTQWSYHTVDQALEDVVYFSTKFATGSVSNDVLKPSNTPWIFIGGSYPGMRAALLRVRNPDVIFASWASSAPVEAQIDMSSYWRTVQNALPKNCSTDLVEMASFVDGALKGSNKTLSDTVKIQIIKAHLGGSLTGVTQSDIDEVEESTVASFLLDPLFGWQDQGLILAHSVCDYLETVGHQVAPTADGVVAKYGIGPFFDAWVSAVSILQGQSATSASTKAGDDPAVFSLAGAPAPAADVLSEKVELGSDSKPAAADEDATISWLYSVCTEFGFFQTTDTKQKSMVSSFVTIDSKQKQCETVFKSMLPVSSPQVGNINKYGGWDMNPSRVFFTAGEIDPWTTLSVASTEGNSPKRKASATVPAYNKGADGSDYFGVVYPLTVHAADLASFASSEDASRKAAFDTGYAMFTKALDVWLPNFKAGQAEDQANAGKNNFTNPDSGSSGSGGSGNGSNAAVWHGAPVAVSMTVIALVGALFV